MIIFFDIETIRDEAVDVSYHNKMVDRYEGKSPFMAELNKILTITVGAIGKDGVKIKNLEGDEKDQIEKFFDTTAGNDICGFNIKGFDIPFIIKRAIHHGIKIPNQYKIYGKKPWDIKGIIDLKEVYNYGVYGSIGSCELACNHLGITSPKDGGIDGSMVQIFYEEGKVDEILEYCKRDVKANIDLYYKFKELNLI